MQKAFKSRQRIPIQLELSMVLMEFRESRDVFERECLRLQSLAEEQIRRVLRFHKICVSENASNSISIEIFPEFKGLGLAEVIEGVIKMEDPAGVKWAELALLFRPGGGPPFLLLESSTTGSW